MHEKQKAMEKAARALSMRAHSEAEIVEKLSRQGFDERTIAEVMQFLAEHQLTDDAAFADQWVRARARRGIGPRKIAWELRQKGIDSEIAEEALAGIDEDEALEPAVALAQKHLGRGDEKARERAYGALVRRGYPYDTVKKALELASEDSEEDEWMDGWD